ncbi:MAG: response regulator transcription factor [Gaiellaceae bacterium]
MSSSTQSVLVVEDEASIASFVSLYLKNAGYEVRTATNGTDALASVQNQQPSLIVLDLMLPDIDGIEICRRIRQKSDVPILMLTARDEDVDKIIGLEVGADDYMTKPFNPRELVARVKSILRRSGPAEREKQTAQLRHGDLLVDSGRREVFVGEEEIQLAPKEFDLLWELLDHRGLVLTRDQLLERVWGYTFAGDTRTVDVHVRQLRRKLGDASPIVTVWGVGYKVAPARDSVNA